MFLNTLLFLPWRCYLPNWLQTGVAQAQISRSVEKYKLMTIKEFLDTVAEDAYEFSWKPVMFGNRAEQNFVLQSVGYIQRCQLHKLFPAGSTNNNDCYFSSNSVY